jgi:AmmeMemoRadiSam system protein A
VLTLSASERLALLRLARASVEQAVHGGSALARAQQATQLTAALVEPRAAFVTLRDLAARDGAGVPALRGCIGSLEPGEPLVECVIRNAVNAACDDPRFPRIVGADLPSLWIEISALTPLRPVRGPGDIVLGRDGVELAVDSRRALFLPQVALEHGWDTPRLLEQLARKAGLPSDAWRAGTLRTFQAEVFHDAHPPCPGP